MATIKSYTDLEQSKKLAQILPLESADMCYSCYGNSKYNPTIAYKGQQWFLCQIRNSLHDDIPCWSLTVLLKILAKIANKIDDDGSVNLSSFMGQWSVNMFDCPVEATDNYDNPVDACCELILRLHELKML